MRLTWDRGNFHGVAGGGRREDNDVALGYDGRRQTGHTGLSPQQLCKSWCESDATESFFPAGSIWLSARAEGLTLCVQGRQTFVHERMPKQAR